MRDAPSASSYASSAEGNGRGARCLASQSRTTGLALSDAHNGLRAMTRRGAMCIRLRQNRMAHASELLGQIAASGLRFVEVPVTIEYSRYSLEKGQGAGDVFVILIDLFARR